MAKNVPFDTASLSAFNSKYDTSREETARQKRILFIKQFPHSVLKKLTIDEYVIGRKNPNSFCYHVKTGTKEWANIQDASFFKFGVYFGKTKSDQTEKYRFAKEFGTDKKEAFAAVKSALLDLFTLGSNKHPNFKAIDANPLSQIFKGKILSLYYPDRFLAICSPEYLTKLVEILGFEKNLPSSQYQNLLLEAKRDNTMTHEWSAPKFVAYLSDVLVNEDRTTKSPTGKPSAKKYDRVDSEKSQKQRVEIGCKAEEYALEWEKQRLTGAGLKHLIEKIHDRRERPDNGYDFLSWNMKNKPRYIEVKCVKKLANGYRFFLSENEYKTSRSRRHYAEYYFYLVFIDKDKKPLELLAVLANQLYPQAKLTPYSHEVHFDPKKFDNI